MDHKATDAYIELSLSRIQARLADMEELLLAASKEVEALYIRLGETQAQEK